ncbi:clustered mitochondria protein homolog [Puma concolor]|uniref:Clustered mitochondria protein homolog n=1 Tax=Puma concolor TaxID=9696 RepID=A0A6P6HEQ6_PUMCO|nr:clustered mitochondria protein homolog [Puma concolor]
MVIKTDELPVAAPADGAREPSSQAGGKGRPGAAALPSVMLLNGDCPESLKREERAPEPPRENGLDESEPGEETTGQEVIVIQDTGFSVKILAPGIEPFSLQVSPQEMVQEIHQVLMDREDTCHRTCFSLHLDGNMLDHFSELRSVEGLQEGSVLRVVEDECVEAQNRVDLVEAGLEPRYLLFMKLAALQLMQQKASKMENPTSLENGDPPSSEPKPEDPPGPEAGSEEEGGSASGLAKVKELAETIASDDGTADPRSREVIRNACKAVGSISCTAFDVRFNPDIFSPGVRFPESCQEEVRDQKQLLKDAAAFLLSCQIPGLVKDCIDHAVLPMDGATLAEVMRQRGINMRYLGKVLDLVLRSPAREQLDHIYKIGIGELITRSAKHIFKTYLQGVELSGLSAAISHFLNCFLSSYPNPVAHLPADELISKKRNRRRRNRPPGAADNTAWAVMTPQELWKNICQEAKNYFGFSLECETVDQAVETYGLQKITLLREISLKTGIQILLKEYSFDSRHKPAFTEEDVLNIFPVVKHVNPKASDAFHFFQSGQAKVQQGFLKEGCELINEALNLFNNVYGAMHVEICACLRLLARLHYIMGDYAEALSNQQKAVLMSERVMGIEHPNTIQEYMHLALYCFASSQLSTALSLLYRARYLTLLVFGEDHPEMALLDNNIGLVLHGVMEYDLSLRFLENALAVSTKYHGPKSLKVALSHHLVARVYESKAEFRSALQHEKEGYTIYKTQLGEDHEKTKESSEYLKCLTQQAVALQRTMNEIYRSGSSANIPPLKFTAPSMASVLEQLNVINGILFIPLSAAFVGFSVLLPFHRRRTWVRSARDWGADSVPAACVAPAPLPPSVCDLLWDRPRGAVDRK